MKLQIIAEATQATLDADKVNLKKEISSRQILKAQAVAQIVSIGKQLLKIQHDEFKTHNISGGSSVYSNMDLLMKIQGSRVFWIPSRYLSQGRYVVTTKAHMVQVKLLRAQVIGLNNTIASAQAEAKKAQGQLKGINVPRRRNAPANASMSNEEVLEKYNKTKDALILSMKACVYFYQLIQQYNQTMVSKYWSPKGVHHTYMVPKDKTEVVQLNKFEYGRLRSTWKKLFFERTKRNYLSIGREISIITDPKDPEKAQKLIRRMSQRITAVVELYKVWDFLDRYARAHKIAVISDK